MVTVSVGHLESVTSKLSTPGRKKPHGDLLKTPFSAGRSGAGIVELKVELWGRLGPEAVTCFPCV